MKDNHEVPELVIEVDLEKTPQEAIDAILEAGEEYGQVIPEESPEDKPEQS